MKRPGNRQGLGKTVFPARQSKLCRLDKKRRMATSRIARRSHANEKRFSFGALQLGSQEESQRSLVILSKLTANQSLGPKKKNLKAGQPETERSGSWQTAEPESRGKERTEGSP